MNYHTNTYACIPDKPAQGGQSAENVFEWNGLAIKIYKDAYRTAKMERKLKYLITHSNSELKKFSAWPLELVYDEKNKFVGMSMEYQQGSALGTVITEIDRWQKQRLEQVTASFLYTVGIFHKYHFALGDFNLKNFIVLKDGRVIRLDIDSLHIDQNNVYYPCTEGFPEYTAPEIFASMQSSHVLSYGDLPHGKSYTVHSDDFSAAIIAFRLLMEGANPFIAQRTFVSLGKEKTPPIEENIIHNRCPYFRKISGFRLPMRIPSLQRLNQNLQILFRRSFVDSRTDPSIRPTAMELYDEVTKLFAPSPAYTPVTTPPTAPHTNGEPAFTLSLLCIQTVLLIALKLLTSLSVTLFSIMCVCSLSGLLTASAWKVKADVLHALLCMAASFSTAAVCWCLYQSISFFVL